MGINKHISALINYAIKKNLLDTQDRVYAINRILDLLDLDEYVEYDVETFAEYTATLLEPILDYAVLKGLIEPNTTTFRDLFDAKIMDCVMSRPSTVRARFERNLAIEPSLATKEYFDMSVNSNYIRKDRTDKNILYKVNTEYGEMDITINLSKPEKDPKDIIAAKNQKSVYPSCLLCIENEGYRGTASLPGRTNHRVIPIEIAGKKWYFQYSPYVYYNEHCIIFDGEHVPMVIGANTFELMLDFVSKFKHYFVGSNADLPIVGGSILSHNHFQGGNYRFAMAEAEPEKTYDKWEALGVKVQRVKWPMSVVRISGKDYNSVAKLSNKVFEAWKYYDDETVSIVSYSGEERHNTVTPIARFKDGVYECDVVLRNNRTDEAHPMGIFHPYEEIHHIKKENIGLIEVMGLAVLPARLVNELELSKAYILNNDRSDLDKIKDHLPWLEEMMGKHEFTKGNIDEILKEEVGQKFAKGLEHCGVFKRDEQGLAAFDKFIESV